MNDSSTPQKQTDFSLVLGGPLYQMFRRAHLSGDALEMVRRRVVIFSLVAWLPLLVLSTFRQKAVGVAEAVPFLLDIEVHIRFLVAMPLLIIAELVVHRRMIHILQQFMDRHLIPDSIMARFDAAVASAFWLRNSVSAEVLLLAMVFGVGIFWRRYVTLDTTTWYTAPTVTGSKLTLAGIWYWYVSIPIFQFLLLRWYFRMFVWARFLWQVSRLDLNLVPTHPDRVGGLGFLSNAAHAFIPLALAHGAVVAGFIASRIFHLGSKLLEFKVEMGIMVLIVQCMVFAPLLALSAQLARTKRDGLREYGVLAARYVREFDSKWLRGGAPADEPFLGSCDIQSLADLNNSFEVVRGMRIVPITRDAILQLGIATVLPIMPLLLTIMPLEQLLKMLAGVLL